MGAILSHPNIGFGYGRGNYYGPGGFDEDDTSAKIGSMVSAAGTTVYGLAEHRKDLFNVQFFRPCLYDFMMRIFMKGKASEEDKIKQVLGFFQNPRHACAKALEGALAMHKFSA